MFFLIHSEIGSGLHIGCTNPKPLVYRKIIANGATEAKENLHASIVTDPAKRRGKGRKMKCRLSTLPGGECGFLDGCPFARMKVYFEQRISDNKRVLITACPCPDMMKPPSVSLAEEIAEVTWKSALSRDGHVEEIRAGLLRRGVADKGKEGVGVC